MDALPSFMLFSIFILLVLSALVSASETAVSASNKIRLQSFLENGEKKAEICLHIKDKQQKVLSTILILNNVINISASTLSALYFMTYLNNIPLAILTGCFTFVLIIFGEIMPKSLAQNHPEKFMMFFGNIINFFTILLTPIVALINKISNILLKPFHTNMYHKDDSITEDDLKTIVNISHEEGVIENEEKEMIHNLFEFSELTVKDIMKPRVDLVAVNVDINYYDLIEAFNKDKYTRIPVYQDSIDNIIGIVILKDFFLYNIEDKNSFNVKNIMREPFFLYENKKVSDTLTEMRKTSNSLAIVLDEYGATSGIVTIEDILEEIVGDIKDEYDADEDLAIKKISDNEYIVDGSLKTDDINEKLGVNIENPDFDSIGGIIISALPQNPELGNEVDYGNYHLKVEEMDNNRITKVRLIINNDENNKNLDSKENKEVSESS